MTYLRSTGSFDLIIRLAALKEKSVDLTSLLNAMEYNGVLGRNTSIISFGPIFGEEAMNELIRRLQALGLSYVDDFIDLNVFVPDWLTIAVDGRESEGPVS
jgi:hypothetical protein